LPCPGINTLWPCCRNALFMPVLWAPSAISSRHPGEGRDPDPQVGLNIVKPNMAGARVFRLWGISRRVSPDGEVLSLACPRESTQRERHPVACPGINLRFMPGYPALRGQTGARATRDLATLDYAQTGRELDPVFPAMLGCARRASNPRRFICRSALLSAITFRHPGEGRDPGVFGKDNVFRRTTPNPVRRSRASQPFWDWASRPV
jgi:hypothetical protein